MLARVMFLVGSILALFGVWKVVSPMIYTHLDAEPEQALLYLIIGGILSVSGYYLEQRNNPDS